MGGGKNLLIVDFDNVEIQNQLSDKLPETFTVKTGRGLLHKYFFSNEKKGFKIFDENKKTLIDVQGEGKQVVGPNSIHPNGNKYEVINDKNIAFINYEELQTLIIPYDKSTKRETKIERPTEFNHNDFLDLIQNKIKICDVLKSFGINTNKNPTTCFLHDSKGGKCLSFDEKVAHCFHCQIDNEGWNIFSIVKNFKKCDFKTALEYLVDLGNLRTEYNENKIKYIESQNSKFKNFDAFISKFVNKLDLAHQFHNIQPIHYDKYKIWWLWNFKKYKWERIDETDILNRISSHSYADTIKSQDKNEIIEALKQIGRLKTPEPGKDTWIQFKNKIIDIENNEEIEASSQYFIMNPIPWNLGNSEETPILDKIFHEWVVGKNQNESWINTLYEILAYCLLPSVPIHRIFCLNGVGSNGKGTFLRLIEKFVGEENSCSSDLDTLTFKNFETSKLYKKLVCIIGEIDKSIFERTAILKRISGNDLTRVEFKGKDSFDTHLYTKLIAACNTLPETNDKSAGFFRRWTIIDFPNQFSEKKDILKNIPDIEFNNLAKKSIRILKQILENGEFTNDGTIEERGKRYEERSNPIRKFINEFCEEDIKELSSFIVFSDFCDKFREYLQTNKFRVQSQVEIGKTLAMMKYERKIKTWTDNFGMHNAGVILWLKWKEDHISNEEI